MILHNQFIVMAVAEKISVLETKTYFQEKAQGADPAVFAALLFCQGGESPRSGDNIIA